MAGCRARGTRPSRVCLLGSDVVEVTTAVRWSAPSELAPVSDDTEMQYKGRIPAYNKLAAKAGERLDGALANIRSSQGRGQADGPRGR